MTLKGPGIPVAVERRRTGRHVWAARRLDLGQCGTSSPALRAAIEDQLDSFMGKLEAPAETVLRLRLEGALDLAGRAALDAAIERGSGSQASGDPDRRALDGTQRGRPRRSRERPLVAEASARLQRSADPAAALALRLLHAEWQRLELG